MHYPTVSGLHYNTVIIFLDPYLRPTTFERGRPKNSQKSVLPHGYYLEATLQQSLLYIALGLGQQPVTAAQRDTSGDKALAFFCSKINKGFVYIKIRVKLESYH